MTDGNPGDSCTFTDGSGKSGVLGKGTKSDGKCKKSGGGTEYEDEYNENPCYYDPSLPECETGAEDYESYL